MYLKYKICLIVIIFVFTNVRCEKAVEVAPPSANLVGSSVYTSNATASAAVTGIYIKMMEGQNAYSGSQSIGLLTALSADELERYPNSNPILDEVYTNSLTSLSSPFPFWNNLYESLYRANAAIEGLSTSSGMSSTLKQQLMGEVIFMRAFINFYLVNIFGDIPLITTTDYRVNTSAYRKPIKEVYNQIVEDLKEAIELLSVDYLSPDGSSTSERVRPNKFAAAALLARVYLYLEDWEQAENLATSIINETSLYSLSYSLNDVFLKNSSEAIWQLQPVVNGYNTFDGYTLILTSGPNIGRQPLYLSESLTNSFELDDKRFSSWIDIDSSTGTDYFFSYKYKLGYTGEAPNEYFMVFRLAEQYLIRSEARAHSNNIAGAQADLNIIRNRAGLPNTTASNTQSILKEIEHERQVELFTEWGHRWLDLKRWKGRNNPALSRADEVLSSIKGSFWQPTDILFPIPMFDIQANPNMTQNPGYF